MRSLIIAIVIIALTFGITTVNTLWTQSTVNNIIDDINALTLDCGMLPRIIEDWESAKGIFSFTVRRVYLREIDEAFQKAEAAIELKDDFEFNCSKSTLIYKMKELCRSQSFDLKSVL